ncbi:MAG TPA: hypothetical protein GX708_15475, partial [Gallicola sp.]|nr:hypothetical protein [Gallicola sp.]
MDILVKQCVDLYVNRKDDGDFKKELKNYVINYCESHDILEAILYLRVNFDKILENAIYQ